LIAATLGGVSIPAAARTNVDFYLTFGPPPVRYEYVPARWVAQEGHWYYHAPGWRSGDRDGDGVPNRYDRFPDNPYRH
jgi:hypothetical protein